MGGISQDEARRRVARGGVFVAADDFKFSSKRERVSVECVVAAHKTQVYWEEARNAKGRSSCRECRDIAKADKLRGYLWEDQANGQRIKLLDDRYSEGTFAHVAVLHDEPYCGHRWTASPANLFAGYGCPECKTRDSIAPLATPKFDQRALADELAEFDVAFAEGAVFGGNTSHSIALQCLKCGYGSDPRDKWTTPPKHVLSGHKCPCCKNLAIPYEKFVQVLEQAGGAAGPDFEKTSIYDPMKGVYCSSCGLTCKSTWANVRSGNSTVCLTCGDPEGHRSASYHKWPLAHLVANKASRSFMAGVYVKRIRLLRTEASLASSEKTWTKVGYGTEQRSLLGGPLLEVERLSYARLPAPAAAAVERECHRRCGRYTIEGADELGIPKELGITEFVSNPNLALKIVSKRNEQCATFDLTDIYELQRFVDDCESGDAWRDGIDLAQMERP